MRPGETLVEMARRHVREGADHVRQQRELVQHLHATGSPLVDEARILLAEFEASEADHQRHLAEIEEEVRAGRRDQDGNLLPLSRR